MKKEMADGHPCAGEVAAIRDGCADGRKHDRGDDLRLDRAGRLVVEAILPWQYPIVQRRWLLYAVTFVLMNFRRYAYAVMNKRIKA